MSRCVLPLYYKWINSDGDKSKLKTNLQDLIDSKSNVPMRKNMGKPISVKKDRFIQMTQDYSIKDIIERIGYLIEELKMGTTLPTEELGAETSAEEL